MAVVEVQLSVYKTHQPRDVECGGVGCLGGKINPKNEHERNNLVVEEKDGGVGEVKSGAEGGFCDRGGLKI